ncbi:17240_t:CDS:2, partial [Gigaspora rosea]
MSNDTLFSFSDPYILIYNEGQDVPFDFFLSNDLTNDNYVNSYDPSLGNDVNFNRLTEESTQLIQEQVNAQEVIQVVHEQQGDEEWNMMMKKSALKRYESEVGFKAIKFRLECDSNGTIVRRYFVCENSKEHQPKKKIDSSDHRERESKKVGCPWQLNAGYRKNDGIVITKLIEEHNHLLASYRKEFAPSLHLLSQEVLDDIKFLTQECGLGANAQCQYISKKFPEQPLYD